jgi:hypothetical protein
LARRHRRTIPTTDLRDFSTWVKERIAKYDFVEGRGLRRGTRFVVPKSGERNI